MNMTNIMILTLVGVVALLTILCCCMGYAIGSTSPEREGSG